MKRFSGSFLVSPRSRALIAMLACLFALWPAPANAREQAVPSNVATAEIPAGLVVEFVDKAGAAARSGIQVGDILLGWSHGSSGGELISPFYLAWLEAEQAPRGAIVLIGSRGDKPRSWTVPSSPWDIEVRPAIAGALLTLHQEALELISKAKGNEAAVRWQKLSEMATENPVWLRLWVKTRAAKELYQASDAEDAEHFYAGAEEACSLAGTEVCRQVLLRHARSVGSRGDFVTGEKYAFRAVETARVEQSPLALAETLAYLGREITNRADTKRAMGYLEEALKAQQELAPDSLETAQTLQILSVAAINNSDLVKAEQFASRSLAILEGVAPQGRDILNALHWLAAIAARRGDLVQEEHYRRRTVQIVAAGEHDPVTLAGSLTLLAYVLNNLGDLGEAEKYARQAQELIEAAEKDNKVERAGKQDFARTLSLIGGLDAQRGDWVHAEAHLLTAVKTVEELDPRSPFLVDVLNALAELFIQKSDFSRAMEYCRRAHELAVHVDPEGIQLVSADYFCSRAAWKGGLVDEAEIYFAEAAALLARSRPGSMDEADANAGLARVRQRQGRFAESQELYEKALSSLDVAYTRLGGSTETRAGYRAELMEYYSSYIDLLMQHGDRDRAFEVLELSRARALLELLNSAHVDPGKASDPALVEELRRLHRLMSAKSEERAALLSSNGREGQLAALEKEMAALAAQAGDVEGRIRTSSPAYAALSHPQPLSVGDVQKLLDPDTLLLEYALGTERSYLFAVSANSLRTFTLPGRAAIDQAARRVYSSLTARNQIVPGELEAQRQRRLRQAQVELPSALGELSRIVLGPVADQLGDQRLIVAADGALNYVPFAMLPDMASSDSGLAVSAPLVLRHEIVNLPSASVLAVLRRQEKNRRPAGKTVAVFADPVFEKNDSRIKQSDEVLKASDSGGHLSERLLTRSAGDLGLSRNGQLSLPRLFFARQEADAIRAVTPRDKIKMALDFQASRSSVTSPELRDYQIVHFATHGLLNSKHPELSGLVLSLVDEHGKPQDGFLQLQDIYNLNLSADLVVLSACETGLGKEINGEGLIGLTRGFMYAGANRVVASLWKISDAATAKLMAEFYRAMETGHMSPAAALRAAQIQMWKKKRWNSPYYWAAFQIQGEWR